MTMAKPTTPIKDDDDAQAPGLLASVPLNDGQVKGLKIAVTVMTGILVLGVLTLFGRIIYLVARPSPHAAASNAVSGASRSPAAAITVPLPAGAVVRQTSLSGERLALHYDGPSGPGIVLVDTITGQIISRIALKPEPTKP
jgi:uncharacterized iron-regulated membrane protein